MSEVRDALESPEIFHQNHDEIILYVRAWDTAGEMTPALECDLYTAGSGTALRKQGRLDREPCTAGSQ